MPIYYLDKELVFPDPAESRGDGLLAVGGDLSAGRLLLAYENGIFPWYGEHDPILWWSPDPRCVLFAKDLKISHSMRPVLNQNKFEIRMDTNFEAVMRGCQTVKRKDQGTWINEEIIEAYCDLFELGVAHSFEAYCDGKLAGGLYGLSMGRMFFGESMFSSITNASKTAFINMVRTLQPLGFEVFDCQIYNDHLGSLGAGNIPRSEFLEILKNNLTFDSLIGNWNRLVQ